MAVANSDDTQAVQCTDGMIEVSRDGRSMTIHSSINPRMPMSIQLTASQSRQLAETLLEITESDGWSVWRQGDDGNAFVMASGLSRDAADEMVRELELHKHKQLFFASQKLHSQVTQS